MLPSRDSGWQVWPDPDERHERKLLNYTSPKQKPRCYLLRVSRASSFPDTKPQHHVLCSLSQAVYKHWAISDLQLLVRDSFRQGQNTFTAGARVAAALLTWECCGQHWLLLRQTDPHGQDLLLRAALRLCLRLPQRTKGNTCTFHWVKVTFLDFDQRACSRQ